MGNKQWTNKAQGKNMGVYQGRSESNWSSYLEKQGKFLPLILTAVNII